MGYLFGKLLFKLSASCINKRAFLFQRPARSVWLTFVPNLKPDDAFNDVFGKSPSSITKHIPAHFGEVFDRAVSHEQAVKLWHCLGHIGELRQLLGTTPFGCFKSPYYFTDTQSVKATMLHSQIPRSKLTGNKS